MLKCRYQNSQQNCHNAFLHFIACLCIRCRTFLFLEKWGTPPPTPRSSFNAPRTTMIFVVALRRLDCCTHFVPVRTLSITAAPHGPSFSVQNDGPYVGSYCTYAKRYERSDGQVTGHTQYYGAWLHYMRINERKCIFCPTYTSVHTVRSHSIFGPISNSRAILLTVSHYCD